MTSYKRRSPAGHNRRNDTTGYWLPKRFREGDAPEVARPMRKKSKWKCRKLKGDHDLVHVLPDGPSAFGQERVQYLANLFQPDTKKSFLSRGAKVYHCRACSKVVYKWNK